jgi:hypothetical protein
MSLFLGKIGRSIVNFTVTRPRLNRAIDGFGAGARMVTFGRYTPGLTRESHILFQRTLPGDKIEVKNDGFYHAGEKIAGNELISSRIRLFGAPVEFQISSADSPELLAAYCRPARPKDFSRNPLTSYFFGTFSQNQRGLIRQTIELTVGKFTPLEEHARITAEQISFRNDLRGLWGMMYGTIAGLAVLFYSLPKPNIKAAAFFACLFPYAFFERIYCRLGEFVAPPGTISLSAALSDPRMVHFAAHEAVHYLRAAKVIKDDRIAETVGLLTLIEQGGNLAVDDQKRLDRNLTKLDKLGADKFVRQFRPLGWQERIMSGIFGDHPLYTSDYEFGWAALALAVRIKSMTGDYLASWEFVKLIGSGLGPAAALKRVMGENPI